MCQRSYRHCRRLKNAGISSNADVISPNSDSLSPSTFEFMPTVTYTMPTVFHRRHLYYMPTVRYNMPTIFHRRHLYYMPTVRHNMPTVIHRRQFKYMPTVKDYADSFSPQAFKIYADGQRYNVGISSNALVNFSQRRQLLAVGTYIYRRSYIRPSGFYARLI